MFDLPGNDGLTKLALYSALLEYADHLFDQETDLIANSANLSALLFYSLPEINWSGFYFLKETQLVLGPFQGKPACVRIALGRGVCGTAAQRKEGIVVPDVHQFPGHIACDHASRSEIVLPLLQEDILLGVLDIDSPILNRFDNEDQKGLEKLILLLMQRSRL